MFHLREDGLKSVYNDLTMMNAYKDSSVRDNRQAQS